MIDDDLDNNPALALLEAVWFNAICPRCDELHALPLHPTHLAALENEAGSRAVDARFNAIESNPPAVPCPYCAFRYGEAASEGKP